MFKMTTREECDDEPRYIGDLCPTRALTTFYFNTKSIPIEVVDESKNLVCFYAKQVMVDDNSHPRDDMKENKLHHVSNATASNSSGGITSPFSIREDYWYFFSPLYFGESPVACITSPMSISPEVNGKIIQIYTFKRRFSGQPPANVTGYFGERIYSHGYFTQSEAGAYQFIRYPTGTRRAGLFGFTSNLKTETLSLAGSVVNDTDYPKIHHCISSKIFCAGCNSSDGRCALEEENNELLQECVVDFHSLTPTQEENTADVVISVDVDANSMKVSKGVDLMEAILLWCAYALFRGKSIGGS